MQSFRFALAALFLVAAVQPASAVNIPGADDILGVPVGTGLSGAIGHDTGDAGHLFADPNSESEVKGWSTAHPYGTFSTSAASGSDINWAGGDSSTIGAFLNNTAINPAGNATTVMATTSFTLNGYLSVQTAGTYTLQTNSDDGSWIDIGSVAGFISNGGSHGNNGVSNSATFASAGNYPVEITYFNQSTGGSGGASMNINGALPTGLSFAPAVQAQPLYLNGSAYVNIQDPTSMNPGQAANIATVAQALTDITGTPTVTFHSTLINTGATYSGNDGATLATFLGTTSLDASTASATTGPVGSFVMDLKGYVTVSTSGVYTFSNNNDDGGAFFLSGNGTPGSGTELAENDGQHGPTVASGTHFLQAGEHYSLEYVYYNSACYGCGYTGSGMVDNKGGGAVAYGTITGPGAVTVSAVPEPASLVLLGLGAVGMLLAARRRAPLSLRVGQAHGL